MKIIKTRINKYKTTQMILKKEKINLKIYIKLII